MTLCWGSSSVWRPRPSLTSTRSPARPAPTASRPAQHLCLLPSLPTRCSAPGKYFSVVSAVNKHCRKCREEALQSYHSRESSFLPVLESLHLRKREWLLALRAVTSRPLSHFLDSEAQILAQQRPDYGLEEKYERTVSFCPHLHCFTGRSTPRIVCPPCWVWWVTTTPGTGTLTLIRSVAREGGR